MNLENLGVQEMNAKEVKCIEGGAAWYDELVSGFRAGTGDTSPRSGMRFSWYSVGYGL